MWDDFLLNLKKYKNPLWGLIAATLISVVVYTQLYQRTVADAMPDQVAAVAEIHTWITAQQNLKKDTGSAAVWWNSHLYDYLWEELQTATDWVKHDRALLQQLAGGHVLAGFSLLPNDDLHPLYAVEVGSDVDMEAIFRRSDMGLKVFVARYKGGAQIITLEQDNGKKLSFACTNQVLLFSRYSYLVEDGITQIEKGKSWWHDILQEKSVVKAPIQWKIRPDRWADRVAQEMDPQWEGIPGLFASLFQQICWAWTDGRATCLCRTAFDLPLRKTSLPDSLLSILPDNLAGLVWLPIHGTDLQTAGFFLSDDNDFKKYLMPGMGDELALAITEPLSRDLQGDVCWVIKISDPIKVAAALDAFGARRGLLTKYEYQTYPVWHLLRNSILGPLANEAFPITKNPACTLLDGYLIVAASTPAIETWIDKRIVGQTAWNDPGLQLLRNQLPKQVQGLVLSNTVYLHDVGRFLLREPVFNKLSDDIDKTAALGWVGMPLKMTGNKDCKFDLFFQVNESAQAKTGSSILWKTSLKAFARGIPTMVYRPDGSMRVFVQDENWNLYCMDESGNILWRRLLDASLLGPVHPLDFMRNNEPYFIGNTSGKVWLLDQDGHDVPGYPLSLKSSATNPLLLVDFDGNQQYSYFVACANGNIYGYDQYSRPISGWNPCGNVGKVSEAMAHWQGKGQDMILVLNDAGHFFAFGRNGKEKFPSILLEGGSNSTLHIEEGAKTFRACVATPSGSVFVLNNSGQFFTLGNPLNTQNARFLLQNLEPGQRSTYVWQSGRYCSAYFYKGDQFTRLFQNKLNEEQDALFGIQGGLGSLSVDAQRIYLFNSKGLVKQGFPLAGSTVFCLGGVQKAADWQMLIVGYQNYVYCYKIPAASK